MLTISRRSKFKLMKHLDFIYALRLAGITAAMLVILISLLSGSVARLLISGSKSNALTAFITVEQGV